MSPSANPFKRFGDPERAARLLRKLARNPHSGDIIALGAVEDDGIINFEQQMSAHGGLGGGQTQAFLLSPPDVSVPGDTATPVWLHEVLKYRRQIVDNAQPEPR